jgi:hypothetical protein
MVSGGCGDLDTLSDRPFPARMHPPHEERKKEPPFPAAFEVDNREASNRVDRKPLGVQTRTIPVINAKA